MKRSINFGVQSQSSAVVQTWDKEITLITQLDNRVPPSRKTSRYVDTSLQKGNKPNVGVTFCVKGTREFSIT